MGREFCSRWQIEAFKQAGGWGGAPGPLDAARVRETAACVPRDVRDVLDAGAGSGWLSHALADRRRVVALDYVTEALRQIRVPKLRGELSRLPFANRAFDLVCCCETIEHLDDAMHAPALRELARVSRQYVLITVPHAEPLEQRSTCCPKCGIRFSPFGHVRSFSERDLRNLFAAIGESRPRCLFVKGIVPTRVFRQNALLERLRPEHVGCWSNGAGTICPQCGWRGYSPRLRLAWRVWSNALRLANAALNPVREQRSLWLLALYEK